MAALKQIAWGASCTRRLVSIDGISFTPGCASFSADFSFFGPRGRTRRRHVEEEEAFSTFPHFGAIFLSSGHTHSNPQGRRRVERGLGGCFGRHGRIFGSDIRSKIGFRRCVAFWVRFVLRCNLFRNDDDGLSIFFECPGKKEMS